MTHEEILNMQAGKKLDALIEQYVFGSEVRWIGDSCPISGEGEGKYPYVVEDYSTNIYAAWEVLEKFKTHQVTYSENGFYQQSDMKYRVIINKNQHVSYANIAPEAICKAALLAVLDSINLPREEETHD